jgi:large repetitive protein
MGSPTQPVSQAEWWLRHERAPIAGIAVEPQVTRVGAPVRFMGSGTPDPDSGDTIAGYDWEFGDGARTRGVTVSHAFTTAGAHGVTLTVTDSSGRTGSVRVPVVALAPTPFPSVPATTEEASPLPI